MFGDMGREKGVHLGHCSIVGEKYSARENTEKRLVNLFLHFY